MSFFRSLVDRYQREERKMRIATILAFIAGAVNAGGFLTAGYYTSNMTAIVSSISNYVVVQQWWLVLYAAVHLACFTVGAVLSALIVNTTQQQQEDAVWSTKFGTLSFALLLEAFFLCLFLICAQTGVVDIQVLIGILCFMMGLQNAMITKISVTRMRTTHMTGIVTDIGIGIGHLLSKRLMKLKDTPFDGDQFDLHLSLLGAFISGGLAGAFLAWIFGFWFVLPFMAMLVILAFSPLARI